VPYPVFKLLHLLGVVLLLGNVTVTAVWKVFADRTGSPAVVAFAQRMVIVTDWFLTLGGVLLLGVGGYGMSMTANIDVIDTRWIAIGQLLFAISGLIWIGILVPTQIAQQRATRAFDLSQPGLPESYRRLSRRWLVWGIIATLPLIAAMYLMIVRW
jgi:uncharacterized membrane protein